MTTRKIKAISTRTCVYTAISSTYVVCGDALDKPVVLLSIKNTTDETVIISEDGTNDHYELPSGTTESYDFQSNARGQNLVAKPVGLQFHVRHLNSFPPSRGKVIIQGQYI